MEIYLIRHGKTLWNKEGRYLGATDQPLSHEGRAALIEQWAGRRINFSSQYVSPMKRCVETAELIFPNTPFTIEHGLRERNFGIFEGKKYDDLKNDPHYIKFIKTQGRHPVEKCENYDDFNNRIISAVVNIALKSHKEGETSICLLCHGGVIMNLLANYSQRGGSIFDYLVDNGGGYSTTFSLSANKFLSMEQI